MIVVDTNVLSEHLKPRPDPTAAAWISANIAHSAITTITVAEMLYGAFLLDDSTRKRQMLEWLDATFTQVSVAGRLFDLDYKAATELARLRAETRRAGRALTSEDLAIAAICRARKLPVATRSLRHFEGLGIDVINPWDA